MHGLISFSPCCALDLLCEGQSWRYDCKVPPGFATFSPRWDLSRLARV